jgi:hypothetical protein
MLEALRNAVLNAALSGAPDESLQQMFLTWVDRFTVWHLRILKYFDNPLAAIQASGNRWDRSGIAQMDEALTLAFPKLHGRKELYTQFYQDLHSCGLTTTPSLGGVMSAQGAVASRTTPLGKQFLRFIAEPPALKGG